MKSIVTTPNPVLSTPARSVTSFDKRLAKLIRDMKAALRAATNPKGVGLAAPQIGQAWRIFVTRPTEKSAIRVFINPKIIHMSESITDGVPERENKLEGCLSIPKIWGRVKRATQLTLKYQDESGGIHTEKFSGFLATIIQHETDHTNGVLFVQRVLEQKGKLYQTALDEDKKEILEEVTIF
ncbi:MAG: peptide deformylase [Candidatus Gottesmanbacteria bacterium]|nr:peptide deformylase [Candidatus Gottesmanbacteria bacterium]